MSPLEGCHKQFLNPGFASRKLLHTDCSLDSKVYGVTMKENLPYTSVTWDSVYSSGRSEFLNEIPTDNLVRFIHYLRGNQRCNEASFLDYGCGIASNSIYASNYFNKVVCVDSSSEALKIAHARIQAEIKRRSFEAHTINNTPSAQYSLYKSTYDPNLSTLELNLVYSLPPPPSPQPKPTPTEL